MISYSAFRGEDSYLRHPFLSLAPPSCMVAPVRDLGNKFFSSATITHSHQPLNLPTVFPSTYTGMDILSGKIPDNYNEVQGRTVSLLPQLSKASSMSSTKSLVAYHERMECNNSLNKDIKMDEDSSGLFYKTHQEQAICVSKAADLSNNILNKHVLIERPTSSPPHGQTVHPALGSPHIEDTVININLLYDPNAPMKPKLWNRNFHPISLHGSMEHLASDSKNIKDSLNFMAKYISNKQVNFSKSNDLENFHGIGEAIWNFISSVYQAKWDSLYADKYSNTLRKKISAKDVSCISFFNQGSIFFLINVYSDSSQLALKYLKDTETNINNVIIMTGDFNIRDSFWDLNFPFHSVHSDMLFDIADSFSLALSKPIKNLPTRFLDNDQNSNSVLDLVFTQPSSMEFNSHHIHLDWRLSSDHAPITVDIPIRDEDIPTKQCSLIKESDEEN